MSRIALLLLCLACAWPALAGFNFMYPRTRTFSDIGRGEAAGFEANERRSRPPRSSAETDFTAPDAYDPTYFRAGGWGRYNYQYHWRDYKISRSGWIFATEAYAQFWGFEASIFTVADAADKLNIGNPIQTNYRLAYTLKIENSINTAAITFQDWGKSHGKINTTPTIGESQGFGRDAPKFESKSTEIALNSYWFPERLQLYNANYFFGLDTWTWVEGPGFRAMASIGAFANSPQSQYGFNGARLQAGVLMQFDYHRKGQSWPGSNFLVEIFRDMREENLPLIASLGMEYFLPFGRDPADALTFWAKLEVVF